MVKIGLAYILQEGRLYTSAGTEIEQSKNLGNVYLNMRILTQKDGDLSSYFEKIDETEAAFTNSTIKHLLFDSHTNDDNKGKIRANLPLEHIFGFCKTFKKLTKGLGFELQIKTSNEKKVLYTLPSEVMMLMWQVIVFIYVYQVSSPLPNSNKFSKKQLEKALLYLLTLG